jgi:hypothetical protein
LEKKLENAKKAQTKAESIVGLDENAYNQYEELWKKACDQSGPSSNRTEWKEVISLLSKIRSEILGISTLKKGRAAVGKAVMYSFSCFFVLMRHISVGTKRAGSINPSALKII